jgi:elongator complex protein 3
MRLDYPASLGREIFLSYEDESGTLFGLLRLRIQGGPAGGFAPASCGRAALVRELHVYGPEVPVGEQVTGAVQHKGLGKALLLEAERISWEEFRMPWLHVLSGIGARQYYRLESGYELKGCYMVKKLSPVDLKASVHHPRFA